MLERVPGGQLQLPRVCRRVRTGDLAESPLIYIFHRIGEIGVVESVERVKTDLQMVVFVVGHGEILVEGHIVVLDPRTV